MDEIEYVKKLIEIGDVEGAIKELRVLLKDRPKNIKAWFLLADIEEDIEKKKECYRQILRYDLNNKNAQDELTKLVDATQKENLSTRVEIQQENSDKKASEGFKFQPRYITALAGLGVMVGALSTWVVSYHGKVKSIEYGFEIPIGIFTLMMGLAIILISVMHKTSPRERSALIASIISFALFVILPMTPLKKGRAGFESGKKSSQYGYSLVCHPKEYGDFRTKVGHSNISFSKTDLISVDSPILFEVPNRKI